MSLQQEQPPIHLIGVPIDAGGGRAGARSGPAALRACGITQCIPTLEDLGDVVPADAPRGESPDARFNQAARTAIALRDQVTQSIRQGAFPLTIGGDHSLSVGSLAAIAAYYAENGQPVPGLVWLDAHLDLNTPDTSPSGNSHGMSAAALLNYPIPGLSEIVGDHGYFDRARCAFIGHRDVDDGERKRLIQGPYQHIPCSELPGDDMESRIDSILEIIAPNGAPFCLSLDIDVVDPAFAPGIDTPVHGGLTPDTVHRIINRLIEHGGLVGMDLVEVNPEYDQFDRTAKLAVEFAAATMRGAQPMQTFG